MPRTLSANSTAAIAVKEGTEPVLILNFDWPGTQNFSTKAITGLKHKVGILEFGGLNQTVKFNGVSSITTINITLDDKTEALKSLVNNFDIEQTTVKGYLYYDNVGGGTPGTQIFQGKIISPYSWNDESRTLQLTIESDIKSQQVGFSIESGQFTVNNEIAVDKVWPIVFGKPGHVPAVLAQKKPAALLMYPINMGGAIGDEELYSLTGTADFEISDWTLIQSYNVNVDEVTVDYGIFYVENSDEFEQNTPIEVIIDGVVFKGSFSGNVFTIDEANAPKYEDVVFQNRDGDDPDFYDPHVAWVDSTYLTLVDHYCYFEKATGLNTTLDMAGEEYIIRKVVRHEGNKIWFENTILDSQTRLSVLFDSTVGQIDKVRALPQNGLLIDLTRYVNNVKRMLEGRKRRTGGTNPYGQLIETLKIIKYIKGAFWSRKEGTEVRQWDANPDIYVANSVESTALVSVYGVRTVDNVDQLRPIPSHYYTVNLAEATAIPTGEGPSTVTTLRFDVPLHAYKDQGWKDTIYVTVQSTLTSNGVEAIKYILDNYTGLTTDATTFSTVAAELSTYEAHFAILEHWDAIDLAENMAYQMRCGLLIDSGTVKIVNLSKEGTSQITFTTANILERSISQSTVSSTDRKTKQIADVRPTYEPELSSAGYNKIYAHRRTHSNKIEDYGLIEHVFDYFMFRNREQVDEAIEFWGNRDSNVWKVAEFTAFHDSIKLEPFDKVTITLSSLYLGSASTKGIIIGINNGLVTGTITYKVLLPMVAGSSSEDDLFWNYAVITTPTNPADSLKIVDYDPQVEKEEITVNNFIAKLQELTSRQRTLGRNKVNVGGGRESNHDDILSMDILTDGEDLDPEYVDVLVDVTNNHIDLADGELVHLSKDGNGTYYVPARWAIHAAKITAIGDNTITVAFVDSRTEVVYATFEVQRPYLSKRLTWDDQTIDGVTYHWVDAQTRTATDGTNTETQVINPAYHVGDWIDIGWSISGGWLDMNTDARSWVATC